MQKFFLLSILLISGLFACEPFTFEPDCGFQGIVYEKLPEEKIGQELAGVFIEFVSEDGKTIKSTESNVNGGYKITLPVGRYTVTAKHPDFEPYSTGSGFFVVTGNGLQIGNFFLHDLE